MVRTASLTAADLADVLVVEPHVVSTHRAAGTLDEDATASGPVSPAVSSLTGIAAKVGVSWFGMRWL